MTRVTALRPVGPGRVAVELDDAPWRVLPENVVVRAGLAVGRRLDRPDLRRLRGELRREAALTAAVRALRARDHSQASLDERLAHRGVAAADRERALGTLERAGLVDDERFALGRARALAGRGAGDGLVRADLERHGLAPELVATAIAALEPEHERAARLFAARGGGPRALRLLASKGFSEESCEALVAGLDDGAVG